VIPPGLNNLFFVGLLQPLGAVMPLAEAQGKFIAAYLRGDTTCRADDQMRADMARERAAMFRRYKDRAPRHTMQVDFAGYLHRLARHARRGRRAAQRRTGWLPVPASRTTDVF
jgi:dimethylaniline monooxygenase (N-oxide forming)